ncbi:MAG: ATP-binding protein, partial [Deltaproteobacteria bacterium]
VSLTVQDDGRPFDPLYAQAPDIHSPLAERPVGGLGIYIVRKMMDEVRYEHRGGRNILTLVKHV